MFRALMSNLRDGMYFEERYRELHDKKAEIFNALVEKMEAAGLRYEDLQEFEDYTSRLENYCTRYENSLRPIVGLWKKWKWFRRYRSSEGYRQIQAQKKEVHSISA